MVGLDVVVVPVAFKLVVVDDPVVDGADRQIFMLNSCINCGRI